MQIKTILKPVGYFFKKHSTKILAGVAIVAEGFGYWFMHKKAPIVRKKLDALGKDAKWTDKAKVAGKEYLVPIGMFALSAASIVGCCAVGESKVAALTAATNALIAKADMIEPDKSVQIQEQAAKKRMTENPPTQANVIVTKNGIDIFYDTLSDRYFTSSADFIKAKVGEMNDLIMNGSDMHCCVNELYDAWDIPHVPLARPFEFNIDRKISISFGSDEEINERFGRHVTSICYYNYPTLYNGKDPVLMY